ncbi:GDSL esterase/lipase 6 [Selaginella moellendorffii]|uniref:GDSL esterase/lipase 6 n=1 Tax=Selaginella moellendorffii TaxID=88036 RepID=UPI000D1CB906|nr:GDSL esterase/lipase 6 [Selaginella moellendorffii]|eukprot:XP_002974070.2 GDSL esterase/lipase 6 [Selaginella moellendorffii]
MTKWSRILVFVVVILALCVCVYGRSVPQLGTIYMGDSIFDVGTNKYVKNSVSRCDFVPYGETRFSKPSGRCSDGFIIPDLINKAIGLPFSRPFLGLKAGSQLPPSINFASDGSGLLDSTHSDWGVVSFNEQLKQLAQLSKKNLNLNDFVVVISSAGNDIAANLQNIADIDLKAMLMSLEKGLEQLYKYGFRKIVYSSVGALGCSPIVTSGGKCVSEINNLVEEFNVQAREIVLGVAKRFPGMKGTFVDGYSLIKSYVENPKSHFIRLNVNARDQQILGGYCCCLNRIVLAISPVRLHQSINYTTPLARLLAAMILHGLPPRCHCRQRHRLPQYRFAKRAEVYMTENWQLLRGKMDLKFDPASKTSDLLP